MRPKTAINISLRRKRRVGVAIPRLATIELERFAEPTVVGEEGRLLEN